MTNLYTYSAAQHAEFLKKHNIVKAANFLEFVSAPQFLGQSVEWHDMSTKSVMDYAHKITFFTNRVRGEINYHEALFLYAIHTQATTLNFHEHKAQPKYLYVCQHEHGYVANRFKDIFRDSPWFNNLFNTLSEYNSETFSAIKVNARQFEIELPMCGNLVIRFVSGLNSENNLKQFRGKFNVAILNLYSSIFPRVKLPYEKSQLIYGKFLSENVDPADLPYLCFVSSPVD
jgi:hypothetical protein